MSVEIAKKRGRPKKVADMHGSFPAALPPAPAAPTSKLVKLSAPKKPNKQPSSTSTATKKSNGSKNKAADASISQKELKTKIATIARAASSKLASKTEPDTNSPPPAVLKAIARQESSSILQQIAALKVEEELKKKAARLSTTPPIPPTQQTTQLAKPLPQLEPLAIPSFQSTTMPSTSTTSSTTFYQWLPNPPILAQRQPTFRTLSTTSKAADATRKARALNRLATEASIPKAREGLNPGGFPVTYKSATRRVTAIIVAMPVVICMSWFLYERCESPFRV